MLISRVKVGKKNKTHLYEYHADGVKVTSPVILKYIRSLVIPPAYTRVMIRYNKNPRKDKVTYVGFDSKGGLDIKNVPATWKAIFKQAGLKPRDLKDPAKAKILIQMMSTLKPTGNIVLFFVCEKKTQL